MNKNELVCICNTCNEQECCGFIARFYKAECTFYVDKSTKEYTSNQQ